MGTRSSAKIQILGDLATLVDEVEDPNWAEFVRVYNVKLPMAYLARWGYAYPRKKGRKAIDQLWDDLLFLLDIENDTGFKDLQAVFDASPHEWIWSEEPQVEKRRRLLPHILPLNTFWAEAGMADGEDEDPDESPDLNSIAAQMLQEAGEISMLEREST